MTTLNQIRSYSPCADAASRADDAAAYVAAAASRADDAAAYAAAHVAAQIPKEIFA